MKMACAAAVAVGGGVDDMMIVLINRDDKSRPCHNTGS